MNDIENNKQNRDNWVDRLFTPAHFTPTNENSCELLNRLFDNDPIHKSTESSHVEKSLETNDIMSRMFVENTHVPIANENTSIEETRITDEKINTTTMGEQLSIIFKKETGNRETDDVIERMFCSTDNADFSEEAMCEIVREISSVDVSIKEHNIHLKKLRTIKRNLEENLLGYLEYFKKEGVRINDTNEIFCSAVKNKQKTNKSVHSSQEIRDFAKSNGIQLNQENWVKFEKLWKKNSQTKIRTVGLKRIKQA
tara:strand:- start:73 stop:834 length:762 start_codon:yes stop_codon:yes gene_type:complete